jgi:hypothetical protein
VWLEQRLIPLDFDKTGDNTADVSRYPNLHRVYIPSGESFPSYLPNLPTLPNLPYLRLEMLDRARALLPSLEQTSRVHSLIIDAPRYQGTMIRGCIATHQSTSDYEQTIDRYRTFIKRACDVDDSGVVIPAQKNTSDVSCRRILAAWANAVAGGVGCWTTAWTPTVLKTGNREGY